MNCRTPVALHDTRRAGRRATPAHVEVRRGHPAAGGRRRRRRTGRGRRRRRGGRAGAAVLPHLGGAGRLALRPPLGTPAAVVVPDLLATGVDGGRCSTPAVRCTRWAAQAAGRRRTGRRRSRRRLRARGRRRRGWVVPPPHGEPFTVQFVGFPVPLTMKPNDAVPPGAGCRCIPGCERSPAGLTD